MAADEPYSGVLTVTARDEDGTAVLVVVGELDADTSVQFREAVERAAGDGASVVADLSGVTFIDSSGLSALVFARSVVGERQGEFSLRSPSPSVARLLEITGQSAMFQAPNP